MVRVTVILVLWAAALRGALALRHAPGNWGHALCGPWGCGPPLQALVAVHLAWLVLLLPPGVAITASSHVPRRAKRMIAIGLVATGFAAVVGVIGYQALVWRPSAGAHAGAYLAQRCVFAVLTTVDFPALQALVTGSWMLVSLRWGAAGRSA